MPDPVRWIRPALVVAKAYRVVPATAGVAALCAVAPLVTDGAVGLGGVPVRSTWFLLLATAAFAALPLAPRLDELERTLVRARVSRGLRAGWFLLASGAAGTTIWILAPDLAVVAWFVVLSSATLLCSWLVPRAALLTVLCLGGGTILVDHTLPGFPVSRGLLALGVWPLPSLLVTVAVYVAAAARSD